MASRDLRKRYRTAFRNLPRHRPATAAAILAGYLAAIVLAVALGGWLLGRGGGWAQAAVPLLMLFVATRLRGLNNIVHECTHHAFAEGRAANARLGRIAAVPLLTCFADYKREHATHHAHLGDPERDLDLKALLVFGFDRPVDGPTLLRHLATPVLGLHLRRYLSVDLSARDGRGWAVVKWGLLALVAVGLAAAPATTLLLVVLPHVWILTALNYWADCLDHAGRLTAADDLHKSRNCVVPAPLRLLFFPRGDCYHLIHHLFPSVPVRHLPWCHARLLADPAYAALRHGPAWPGAGGPTEWRRCSST